MKNTFVCALVFSLLGIFTITAKEVKLPAIAKKGGKGIFEVLNNRKTVRAFKGFQLTDQQISTILWCANGVNRPNGKRTAPSAINRQEIQLYLVKKDGAYFYNAVNHSLIKVSNKDLRKNCGNFEAPIYLILVADMKKAASEHFAKIDSGYVSMNIYLACGALNLGTCAIGSFDRNKAAYATLLKELNFSKDMRVLLTHCIGVPK
jgi:SagB-type dehydrogenase family enzyme